MLLCIVMVSLSVWFRSRLFTSRVMCCMCPQVKCELRVLAQFSFRLNPDWELPAKKSRQQPLRDGVQDMLVKHHLFSWDL